LDRRCISRVLLGRPDEKRQLGRSRRRWKDNIKMDITEMGWGGTEGIDLGQDIDM
jgi:hypothetical protein